GPEPVLPPGVAFLPLPAPRDRDARPRRRVASPHLWCVLVDAAMRAAPLQPPCVDRSYVAVGGGADLHPGSEHGPDDRLLAARPRLRIVERPRCCVRCRC